MTKLFYDGKKRTRISRSISETSISERKLTYFQNFDIIDILAEFFARRISRALSNISYNSTK